MTTAEPPRQALTHFAFEALAADRYPTDHHRVHFLRCDTCGVVPLALSVEHHTGSTKRDFRGVVRGTCRQCATESYLFHFVSQQRELLYEETVACKCGNALFWTLMAERIEGEDGLPGFFDEGVIVGHCTACQRQRIIVAYD